MARLVGAGSTKKKPGITKKKPKKLTPFQRAFKAAGGKPFTHDGKKYSGLTKKQVSVRGTRTAVKKLKKRKKTALGLVSKKRRKVTKKNYRSAKRKIVKNRRALRKSNRK